MKSKKKVKIDKEQSKDKDKDIKSVLVEKIKDLKNECYEVVVLINKLNTSVSH